MSSIEFNGQISKNSEHAKNADIEMNSETCASGFNNSEAIVPTTSSQSNSSNSNQGTDSKSKKNKQQKPKKNKTMEYAVSTHNPYDSLSESDNETDEESTHKRKNNRIKNPTGDNSNNKASTSKSTNIRTVQTNSNNNNASSNDNRKTALPPIIVKGINSKELERQIRVNVIGNSNFTIKIINKSTMHLQLQKLEDFNKAKLFIQNHNQISGHTYTPKESRSKNIVLKGLPVEYTNEEIKEELQNLNIQDMVICNINNMSNYQNHRIIQVSASSPIQEFFKVNYILSHRIKWEKLATKENATTQCKNCQRYGHVAINCLSTYRCVKCVDSHPVGQCPRNKLLEEAKKKPDENGVITLDDKVACVNCKQVGHPANHKTCRYYKEYISRKQRNENIINQTTTTNHYKAAHSRLQAGISYANMAHRQLSQQQSQQHPNETTNHHNSVRQDLRINHNNYDFTNLNNSNNGLNFIQQECHSLFGSDLLNILKSINEFLPRYRSITDVNQKKETLIMFMFGLCSAT